MATVVELPRLSDTMEEGVIAKWRIKVGDKVKRGQVIAEIETDKATMEFESFDSGTVLKLVAAEGETLPLGAPIAVLGQPGEDPDAGQAKPAESKPAESAPAESKPGAAPKAAPAEGAEGEAKLPDPKGQEARAEVQEQADAGPKGQVKTDMSQQPARDDGRIPASPLARRLAREHDLEISQIPGTGPHGRVVKTDVEQAIAASGKAMRPRELTSGNSSVAVPARPTTPRSCSAAIPSSNACAPACPHKSRRSPCTGIVPRVSKRSPKPPRKSPHCRSARTNPNRESTRSAAK